MNRPRTTSLSTVLQLLPETAPTPHTMTRRVVLILGELPRQFPGIAADTVVAIESDLREGVELPGSVKIHLLPAPRADRVPITLYVGDGEEGVAVTLEDERLCTLLIGNGDECGPDLDDSLRRFLRDWISGEVVRTDCLVDGRIYWTQVRWGQHILPRHRKRWLIRFWRPRELRHVPRNATDKTLANKRCSLWSRRVRPILAVRDPRHLRRDGAMAINRQFVKRAHLIAESTDRTVEVVIDPSANRLSWVRYRCPIGELMLGSELAVRPLGLIVYLSQEFQWWSGRELSPADREQITADLENVIRLLVGVPFID